MASTLTLTVCSKEICMPPSDKFRLGEKIGSGSFGHVFQAHDTATGRVVALKKARASLQVQRPIVYHEARILRLLVGHPSIPAVFAYGRFEHFEYLAMELLGPSLGEIIDRRGRLPLHSVSYIADQMLSVLEHIHKVGIVHRDIKPNNILLSHHDTEDIFLIDFGIARPCLKGEPSTHDPIDERRNIVGTLKWASLNSHHGIDLGPRDDIESLAYTLIFLLRGELPWDYLCRHGTTLSRIAHIREKKKIFTGSRLADGNPPIFGQLLDYARSLAFHETVDYARFRAQFGLLKEASGASEVPRRGRGEKINGLSHKVTEPPQCPVQVGQLVRVQIDARTSIEGYGMRRDDASYWRDPSISPAKYPTRARPAVVTHAAFDAAFSVYKIHVAALGRGAPPAHTAVLPVATGARADGTLATEPAWPVPDTYCYAFPGATEFYCLPTSDPVPVHWKIRAHDLALLQNSFVVPRLPGTTKKDPDADVRYARRMQFSGATFFVTVLDLGPRDLERGSADDSDYLEWRGDRAWFDERVMIARRVGWDGGVRWTDPAGQDVDKDDAEEFSDSYFSFDYSMWQNRQGNRARSLTLNSEQVELVCARGELRGILEVV